MVMGPGTPTLDQLRIFLTIVEAGSFAGAARRLGRAVSVISYGVANLESQLGLLLFEREGTRVPRLTTAGEALLAEARAIRQGVDGLRAKAAGLIGGLEAEVALVVDVMLPAERLGAVLRAFATAFPTVRPRLHVEALGAVAAMVEAGDAVLGISGPVTGPSDALERAAAGTVELVPVAAPSHALGAMAPIAPGATRDHVQLVLSDRSRATEGRDFAVISPRTWRLADLGAKHALLREGIGWGNMPLPMVADDLARGRLVRLDLPEQPGGIYRFNAVWRRDAPPGAAGGWLRDQFVERGRHDGPADV